MPKKKGQDLTEKAKAARKRLGLDPNSPLPPKVDKLVRTVDKIKRSDEFKALVNDKKKRTRKVAKAMKEIMEMPGFQYPPKS